MRVITARTALERMTRVHGQVDWHQGIEPEVGGVALIEPEVGGVALIGHCATSGAP